MVSNVNSAGIQQTLLSSSFSILIPRTDQGDHEEALTRVIRASLRLVSKKIALKI